MISTPIPSKGNLPKSLLFGGLVALGIMPQQGISAEKGKEQPNVIVILADDVGYGDLSCYGATKVKTPNIDQLASEGIRFTSAYAPASTCTPSRFSLITGQYAWRKNAGILPGDAPMLINPNELTLPALMQKQGYTTACVGKWHLGLGEGNPDFNHQIKPGLQTIGFDYSFIIPATNDRVPCVYLENDQVVGLESNDPIQVSFKSPVGNWPTGKEHPELLKLMYLHGHDQTIVNGISRIGYMTGGKNALWVDEHMSEDITTKAVEFIQENKDQAFFLYFAPHTIHEPRVPNAQFKDSSECGVYGDVLQEMDWSVGQIMKALKENGLDENTLVIFSSDNGPRVEEGYRDGGLANLNSHDPAGGLRGGKYTLFEGGTRMPLISRWKGTIKPGTSDAIWGYIDLFASFAELTNYKLEKGEAPDSRTAMNVILGKRNKTSHNEVLTQNNSGANAIRKGDWKFIPQRKGTSQPMLFNLKQDVAETNNLSSQYPKKVEEFETILETVKQGKGYR